MSGALDEQVRAIMSALSNEDALLLFNLAEEGIESYESIFKTHGLSKKRYYQRLHELVTLGLVYKDETKYRHTMLGSMIFENQVKGLRQMLLNRGSIRILHELRNRLEDDENARNSVNTISQEVLKNLESSLGVSGLKPIRLHRSWDDLVEALKSRMEKMRSEMFIASRYVDFRTAESAIDAASRNCKLRIIHSNRGALSERLQIFGNLIANPQSLLTYRRLTKSPNVTMRKSYVPYSFLVIDNVSVGIEIVNPSDPSLFFLGIWFESPVLAQSMRQYFEALWTIGEMDDMTVMFEKPVEDILREVEETRHAKGPGLAADRSV
ncbi:MAG: hypothetical protein M1503_00455 [Thaumarchaeota archaeon]|nr:hypothetical protein [Nitrososphaerota archaeon]MCL5316723.1 hypothetical protein [Nitrososphaerota archaeon]